MEWEVAAYRGQGVWEPLGRAEGSSPRVGLQAWWEERGIEHERYGVRSPGAAGWIPFRPGPAGHPIGLDVIE